MTQLYNKNDIKAIIGLGNPGAKYYKTRHSIGFRVLDELASRYSGLWQESDTMHYAGVSGFSNHTIYLIKPQTFMNNSGEVLPWLSKKGIKAHNIVVVHDELEKNYGVIQLRFGGSAKGHNGLRSIIGMIGPDFWRLRFGIGRPLDQTPIHEFVLNVFNQKEEDLMPQNIATVCDILTKD